MNNGRLSIVDISDCYMKRHPVALLLESEGCSVTDCRGLAATEGRTKSDATTCLHHSTVENLLLFCFNPTYLFLVFVIQLSHDRAFLQKAQRKTKALQ